MLSGIRIFSADSVWRQILGDLGARVIDTPDAAYLNFDELDVPHGITPLELKSIILNVADNGHVLRGIFGCDVSLPRLQGQIVVLLHKSGGMTINELKHALGYAPDVTTHTVDTAIYQLRRVYGRGFIKNTNGVYTLGRI